MFRKHYWLRASLVTSHSNKYVELQVESFESVKSRVASFNCVIEPSPCVRSSQVESIFPLELSQLIALLTLRYRKDIYSDESSTKSFDKMTMTSLTVQIINCFKS